MILKPHTPLLGWNSYDSYGIFITEKEVLENLDAFVSKIKPYHYLYFCIDAGWYSDYLSRQDGSRGNPDDETVINHIDEYGRFVASPTLFPDGLASIAEKVHAQGLRFGIHIMRGIPKIAVERNTPIKGISGVFARDIANVSDFCPWCRHIYGVDMSKPGAQEYYDSVVDFLADEGVDFIKADDIVSYPDEIDGLIRAVERNPRRIVLSLSPGDIAQPINAVRYQRASMLRITGDVWDRDLCIARCFERWESWAPFAQAGFFLDLDMIPFGALQVNTRERVPGNEALSGEGCARLCAFDLPRKRTLITMLAMAASPMIMGGSLTLSPREDFDLITNEHILHCNQNGISGRCILYKNFIDVRKTPDARIPGAGWLGIFNRHSTEKTIRLTPGELGFGDNPPGHMKSLWESKILRCDAAGCWEFCIRPCDVVFIRYEEEAPEKAAG